MDGTFIGRKPLNGKKKLGVIPSDAKLTPWPDQVPSWDSLSADQKRRCRARCEVYEEGLLRRDGMLITYPGDRLVGHGGRQIVILVSEVRFYRRRIFKQIRRELLSHTTDKPIEILKAFACGPMIKGTCNADSHIGTWCHFPKAAVLYPLRRKISAIVAVLFGSTPS